MWRKLAPRLAAEFTVVVPDLRGYGDSAKPPAGPDNAGYSKRALALDQVETMASLGFDRFAVAGHDRGARVAQYRAGASVGLAHDRADRAATSRCRFSSCGASAARRAVATTCSPSGVSTPRPSPATASTAAISSPKRAPEETYRALQGFFAGGTS